MSNLIVDRFKAICPDTWVAQAYGEYLADCAATQADLLSAYAEIAADDAIDNAIDALNDAASDALDGIRSTVLLYLAEEGYTGIESIEMDSDEYIAAFVHCYTYDREFATIVVGLHSSFPCVPAIGPDFTPADMAAWLADHGVDYIISQDADINAMIDDAVDDYMESKNYAADAPYTLNDGYVKIKDLLHQLSLHASIDDSIPMDISFQDVDGNTISLDYSPSELIEQIKTNFASCTAWSQGFLAMTRESVTEALAAFEAGIGTIISSTQERFAATVAQVKATISETRANISSFLEACDDFFGFSKIAEDTFTTVDDTSLFSYTGASPLAGINLKTVAGVAAVTGKAVAAIAVGIWGGIKKLARKVWKKVAPIVKALTNDPVDIEVCDANDKRYSITNFYYQGHSRPFEFNLTSSDASHIFTSEDTLKWKTVLRSLPDNWYSVDTYFFSFSFKFDPITSDPITSQDRKKLYLRFPGFEFKLKPKCLNVDLLTSYGIIQTRTYNSGGVDYYLTQTDLSGSLNNWESYESFLDTNDIYFDDVSKENKMWAGFLMSIICGSEALSYAFAQMADSFEDEYGYSFSSVNARIYRPYSGSSNVSTTPHTWNPTSPETYTTTDLNCDLRTPFINSLDLHMPEGYTPTSGANPYPDHVTNADFICAACGPVLYSSYDVWNDASRTAEATKFANITGFNIVEGQSPLGQGKICHVAGALYPFIAAFIMQQFDKYYHPSEYAFLPYCKNSYSFFDEGRYHIKTDAQNKNVAQVMLNAIVAIAVVVAAVLICKSIIKIFKFKKMSKLQTRIGVMDNATWNGKKLSIGEQRKYRRWSKKMDKLTGASAGLAGSAASSSIVTSAVGAIKDKVVAEVDIPATIAQGTVVQKEHDVLTTDVPRDLLELRTLIAG